MRHLASDEPDICGKMKLGRDSNDDIRLCGLPRGHPGPCQFVEPGGDGQWNKWDLDDSDAEELVPA